MHLCERQDTAVTSSYFSSVTFAIAPASQSGVYAGEAQLQDNFDDDTIDTSKWNVAGQYGAVTETGQGMVLTVPAGVQWVTSTLEADANYNMTGRWAGVELVSTTNDNDGSYGELTLDDGGATSNQWVWLNVSDGYLHAGVGWNDVWSDTYDPVQHRFLRIREANGVTYWETSTDGTAWTSRYAVSNPIDMTNVRPSLNAGIGDPPLGVTNYYTFDNFYLGTSDYSLNINTSNYIILQGGNNFGSHLQIGTLESHNLSFMTNSQQVATFSGNDGSVLFRNYSNSTTAFQIVNTNDDALFTADTANMAVLIDGTLGVDLDAADTATQVCLNSSGNLATCTSSSIYKSDISSLSIGLDALRQLNPVGFTWTSTGQADLGFLAEEVAEILPQSVTYDAEGKVKSFNYNTVTALLVSSVKQLDVQVQSMNTRLLAVEQGNFAGNITVGGKIIGNEDTRGTVLIEAGQTLGTYTFTSPYEIAPNIVATPLSNPGTNYWVSDVTEQGFAIHLAAPANQQIQFNFQAQQ